ncbi:MAG TPA: retroviral-like aspartic protease family protein [Steroidobacteraceae bacterium]|jgi:tetratricopeptide (TPR) repeat protein/predicted aspartyl protease|nr:retroviral-like aspartic protease family protein [Steroidobacteraceae bacterium]
MAAGLSMGATVTSAAPAKCQIAKFSELPVSMIGSQPRTTVNLNGVDLQLVIDSGNVYTAIPQSIADQLKLKYSPSYTGWYTVGIGNSRVDTQIAQIKTMSLPGIHLTDTDVTVGMSEIGAAGLLGQDILHLGDVEYDLAQGAVRLFRTHDCSPQQPLAYWANGSSTAVSDFELHPEAPFNLSKIGSHFQQKIPDWAYSDVGVAELNGQRMRILIDTGAGVSFVTAAAAERAGVRRDSPGVTDGGYTHGVGRAGIATFIARFDSFKIGQEEIHNARLRVAVADLPGSIDMLVGPDFLLSHRVYVANSQHRVYFTYNGGPVFDLSTHPDSGAAATATFAATSAATPPAAAAAAGRDSDTTEDAGDHARLGEALAARNQLDQALTELNRACELAPDNAEYLYQRGVVLRAQGQADKSLADFNKSIELVPNDVRVRLARAELRLETHDKMGAIEDLNAADAAAAPQANERLQMAVYYEHADRLDAALGQTNRWIDSHREDATLPRALEMRCWIQALQGTDLPSALHDCNQAMGLLDKANPLYAKVASVRGLVLLRMANYDQSIASYSLSLKLQPKDVMSLYGRGIDELRLHKDDVGNADIAQATTLSPGVDKEFARHDIRP